MRFALARVGFVDFSFQSACPDLQAKNSLQKLESQSTRRSRRWQQRPKIPNKPKTRFLFTITGPGGGLRPDSLPLDCPPC